MNASRLDTVSQFFTERRLSRRRALAEGGAGLAAAGLAAAGLTSVAAQDATPEPEAADAERGPEMLFVQSFQSGSIAPAEGTEGRFTVTLERGLGQTIYFSDRPDRIVGANPTPQFLEGLGFLDDNPPNAALVMETATGETDIAVVELFNPTYDEASHTATYEVAVLANWEDSTELGFADAPGDLAALAPTFGAAHLFIDDCPDLSVRCYRGNNEIGRFPEQPMCWNYSVCIPCEPYGHTQPDQCATLDYWMDKCNAQYPDSCQGSCELGIYWPWATSICIE